MNIAVLSDIHLEENADYDVEGALKQYLQVHAVDVLILAGDIDTDYENTITFVERLEAETQVAVRYVPGNHDLWNTNHPNETTDEIYEHFLKDRHCLSEHPFFIGDYVIIGDIGWYDYSYGTQAIAFEEFEKMQKNGRIWQDSIRNQWTKDNPGRSEYFIKKLQGQLEDCRKQKKILVTHMVSNRNLCVPWQHGDWAYFNAFLGSAKLEELIRNYGVEYAVCGHVHFRNNIEQDGTTWMCRCLNYEREWLGNKNIEEQLKEAIGVFQI